MKLIFDMDVAQVTRQHIYNPEGPAKFCLFCLNCSEGSDLYSSKDFMCSGRFESSTKIYPGCFVSKHYKPNLWKKV